MDPQFWSPIDKVSEMEKIQLDLPFIEEEIKEALFDSEATGAPGPDGFTFLFYQIFWELVKPDILSLCHSFYNNTLDLHRLNKFIICLILKGPDAHVIYKFRPISLVNCSFKLLSKIMTNRLEGLMNRLIDDSQTAFLKG